jgi:hypothetical protein
MRYGTRENSASPTGTFFRLLITAVTLVLLLAGCAGKLYEHEEIERLPVNAIAVLPVEIVIADKADRVTQEKKLLLEEGRETMDRLISEYFAGKASIRIISEDEIAAMPDQSSRNRTARARSISQTGGQDAVLLVTLHEYQKRHGTTYSVDTPPSVTFDDKLIMAETGRERCSGLFQETQQPLTSNIFNFFTAKRRGFKWITAEEMAGEGIRNKFGDCPYLQ